MLKNLEKKCVIGNDTICINVIDTRDSYIYDDAMGDIGNIFISRQGVLICPDYGSDDTIIHEKEIILIQTFKELFGVDKYNPLSSEYYTKINNMIHNGTLSTLRYTIEEDIEFDLFEYVDFPEHNEPNTSNYKGSRR